MDDEPIITGEEAPPEAPIPPVESEVTEPPVEPASAEDLQDALMPAKSGGGKGMIVAIAVIAVVAIMVIAFMFIGGTSHELEVILLLTLFYYRGCIGGI